MSYRHYVDIVCDGNQPHHIVASCSYDSEAEAWAAADERGWTTERERCTDGVKVLTMRFHYCPKCSKARAKEGNP